MTPPLRAALRGKRVWTGDVDGARSGAAFIEHSGLTLSDIGLADLPPVWVHLVPPGCAPDCIVTRKRDARSALKGRR